ncbi:MAG: GIY-YIG nuclease family protein, partial [Bacteroidetes bacterium]|nr:GIY-YIG nuclease family protein [Bacteroidota bacterium]
SIKNGNFYTGYTKNLRKRFKEHNEGKSLYTKLLSNNEKNIRSNFISGRKKVYSPKDRPTGKLLNEFDNNISKTAKRLKISKGELLLASKIKSIEMDKAYSI